MRENCFAQKQRSKRWKPAHLLLTIALSCISVAALSQTVTIRGNNLPFKKVLAEIKKQTGYTFFNNSDLLNKAKNITIDVRDMPLKDVLNLICKGQPFTCSIVGKVIAISPLEEKKTAGHATAPPAGPSAEDSLIHGRIRNTDGTPLTGVSVANITDGDPQKEVVISNGYGSFAIAAKKGDKLLFTSIGYGKKEMKYSGELLLNVTLKEEIVELDHIVVNNRDFSRKKIPWTDTIDMTHRSHLNLGQLLQGTIPGLTLQSSSQSQTGIQSIDFGGTLVNGKSIVTLEELRIAYEGGRFDYMATSFDDLLQKLSASPGLKVNYSTSVNSNGFIPQLRGVSGFNGNTSGMLIVIDGFAQDGFPADYPMTNVESVKVIKDPEELTKWGPKAAGGLILITSKRGMAGKLQLSYATNFYYAPAPRFDRSRQQLASSGDVLDYLKAGYDSGFVAYNAGFGGPNVFLFNHNPADILLYKLSTGAIPQDAFHLSWDSLRRIDNQGQLRLLQQNTFNQNQLLTLSGGSKGWRFRATGSYNTSRTTALGNYTRTIGMNTLNEFNLFNNKLNANWQMIVNRSQARLGNSFDPTGGTLPPYQLLLDANGNYVYDYSRFNPEANAVIMNAGYENYGANLLQDARVNSNITRTLQVQSFLNTDWSLLPGLKWTNSFQYMLINSSTEDIKGAESSQVRQLVDDYGSPVFTTTDPFDPNRKAKTIIFHLPQGDMLQSSFSRTNNWNLRTALIFTRQLGRHDITVTAGGSGSANTTYRPAWSTRYGYDPRTGIYQPVLLPLDPLGSITNYSNLANYYGNGYEFNGAFSPVASPFVLLTPNMAISTVNRQLGWNGSWKYAYDGTYIFRGNYNAVLNPSYGNNPPWSILSNYDAEAAWKLLGRSSFLHAPAWVSDISLSTGVTGNNIPSLPVQINATRNLQSEWNNYGIWVNSYNLAQQTGQNTRNIYEKLTIGIADNRLLLDLIYNNLDVRGNAGNGDSSFTRNFFGANTRIKFRKGLLNLIAGYGRSPEGQTQLNLRAGYDIARETYFYSKTISSLSADFSIQNISPYQSMELMMGTNAPSSNGAYSMAINSNFGLLPPQVRNTEAHATIGFNGERYRLDIRYYNKSVSGLNNNIPVPTDPSSGLGTQVSYSRIVNRGVELYLVIKPVQQKNFTYTITLNGAWNKNIARQVPLVYFSQTTGYLTAYRNGYSTENLWSYRWAGLDNHGNPQIYDPKGEKTASPDSATLASALVYSGVTRAPYTGGFIQEWNFHNFFARVTLLLKLGHVMRKYIPSPSGVLDNSLLIRDRWRNPGDELHTDVPAMANTNTTTIRTFITQSSSNSILPADNIRLQEVQIGWQAPTQLLQNFFVKNLTLSLQVQNAAVWTRNRLHVDPETVSSGGQIGLPITRQYSFSVNTTF